MRVKFYVGKQTNKSEVFKAVDEPTQETHGNLYAAVIGPFRTKRGANYMALYGNNNPHCQCVSDAEKLSNKLLDI